MKITKSEEAPLKFPEHLNCGSRRVFLLQKLQMWNPIHRDGKGRSETLPYFQDASKPEPISKKTGKPGTMRCREPRDGEARSEESFESLIQTALGSHPNMMTFGFLTNSTSPFEESP